MEIITDGIDGFCMGLAVILLAALFESQIYVVSSLFIGFIAGSIPLIIKEESESLKQVAKGIWFGILGAALVVGISWLNGQVGTTSMDLGQFSMGLGIKLFLIGMIAISAMFLPGISGSTLLLIFGAYIPAMTFSTFHIIACIVGVVLVLGMQKLKEMRQ